MVGSRLRIAATLLVMCVSAAPHSPLLSPTASPTTQLSGIVAASIQGASACEAKCTTAGHCCIGLTSACQKPSCAQGCVAATHSSSELECNATCEAAAGPKPGSSGCKYSLPHTNVSFEMCGSCRSVPAPAWWPAAARPPNGQPPAFWPPGYSLPDCSSCETIDQDPVGECKLGCMFIFRQSLKPVPPVPPNPPDPRPAPPACGVFPSVDGASGCTIGAHLNFSTVFGSHMVLQRGPARAAVYGYLGHSHRRNGKVTVRVSEAGSGTSYTVNATVDFVKGAWKALLPPTKAGGTYRIAATCESGCTGTAEIDSVTFGDVWYCSGQSNMALPVQYTYGRNETIASIKQGSAGSIRLTGLKGNMNIDQPWISLQDAAGDTHNHTVPGYGQSPLDHFSSTCLYFGIALSQALAAQNANVPPIGLIHTAWGGSMIEEWLTADKIASCKGADIAGHNSLLHNTNVLPYVDMTIKGWVWYQGENNAGGLHGNSGTSSQTSSGYACMMPKLVSLWREQWSTVPNTTDPMSAFGIVSLSSHDSEGAADMASFRWAQQASYGTVPNKALPNTFMAHAFDLQDPWNGNTGSCDTTPLPYTGYDCHTPWFMGPGIHPRLKQPVGQRLALGAMQAAYGHGGGAVGGVLKGCTLTEHLSNSIHQISQTLTLSFDMKGRQLQLRGYNSSDPVFSATAILVNTSNSSEWKAVHINRGSQAGTIAVDLTSLPAGAKVSAVRYAWGGTGTNSAPNGDDISCCEGDGLNMPCVPTQCPLLATEPLAPFGHLPVDPFVAEIKSDGKCLCPEPQVCSE